jgi:hypothetical protein
VSGLAFFVLAAIINALSVVLYVLAVREHKRVNAIRRQLRLDQRGRFGDGLAGDFPRSAP